MSAPHEISGPTRDDPPSVSRSFDAPSRARLTIFTVIASALTAVVLLGLGNPDRVRSAIRKEATLEGQILWQGDGLASVLGPNGWFADTSGRGVTIKHLPSGRSYTLEDESTVDGITPDGHAFYSESGDGSSDNLVITDGRASNRVSSRDILEALGDDDLWPGADVEAAAASETVLVVQTCLAGTRARVGQDAPGGRLVLAGVTLDDGEVGWTHDSGVGCAEQLVRYEDALPAQRHALLRLDDSTRQALQIATGKVVRTWRNVPFGGLAIQGDHAMQVEDGTVRLTSIKTGKELDTAPCVRGSTDYTDTALPPQAHLAVACKDRTQVVVDDAFVTVEVPPTRRGEGTIDDGREVSYGRWVLRRDGDQVTVRDGLSERTVGTYDIPKSFAARSMGEPVGRGLVFADASGSGPKADLAYILVDTETGDLLARTSNGVAPGPQIAPDGYALFQGTARRGSSNDRTDTWVVGPRPEAS